jgi:CheY-like chemotaxis protein
VPHKILIVDDDPVILEVLKNYVGGVLRYEIGLAEDGETGLELALKGHYHLCILDVNLPGLSGAEIYMRLKTINPNIEAIFFTGDQDFEHTMDFMRFSLPRERVLTKPLKSLSDLTRLIVSILGPPAP